MNESLIIFIVFALVAGWIFVLIRHYYLIRFPFQKYMSIKYPTKWDPMKNDSNLTATWVHPYFSQSVYNFIWKSKVNFNDPIVETFKKRIRWSGWYIPLYFLFVGLCGLIMTVIDKIIL